MGTVLFALGFSQENLTTWAHYKNISLNTKSTGAAVTTAQTNFPVLIRLTSAHADVFTGALATGADIRFTNQAGKPLPYQIERWDKTNTAAEIWVKADTVKGNDSVASIKMYWGKTGAADSSKGSVVFDTANGFQAVFHMNDAGSGPALDATKNNFSAAAAQVGTTAGLPKDTVGLIGTSKKFNANSGNTAGGYYNIQNSASGKLNFLQGDNYSISAWVYCEMADAQFRMIVCKNDNQYTLSTKSSGGTNWEFNTFTSKGWEDVFVPATGNQWVHVVGCRSGAAGTEFIYVNGALAKNTITTNAGSGGQVTNTNVFIGAMPGSPAQRFWAGRLDEIQMSNVVRSADWIKLGYQNQKNPQSLVTLGASMNNGTSVQSGRGNLLESSSSITLRVSGSAPIVFEKPVGSNSIVMLHIFDARGRIIRSKSINLIDGNSLETVWDGTTETAARACPGMYLARMVFTNSSTGAIGNVDKKLTLF